MSRIYELFEDCEVRAVILKGHRVDDRLIEREGLDGTEIPRAFHSHVVTGIQEYLCEEVKALLRAVYDLDLICSGGNTETEPISFRDKFPEREIPVRSGVLKRCMSILLHNLAGCFINPCSIDEVR